MNILQNFHSDDQGAVTVDWVVLTAAIVLMGIGVLAIFGPGADSSANAVSGAITTTVDNLIATY